MLSIFVWLQTSLEDLPEEVLERLPEDIVQQLKDGVIDKIPQDVIDKLPEGLRNAIPPGFIDAASSNPLFAAIGVLALIGFGYGVMKSAVKAALFFGLIAGIAWYFFLR